jgi:phage shock protein PspC (stress-responsive transcriptional regulator)
METKKFFRSRTNKKIAGVCGGLGEFFKIDPIFWRLIFLMGGIFACPFFVVTYIAFWIVAQKEPLPEVVEKV